MNAVILRGTFCAERLSMNWIVLKTVYKACTWIYLQITKIDWIFRWLFHAYQLNILEITLALLHTMEWKDLLRITKYVFCVSMKSFENAGKFRCLKQVCVSICMFIKLWTIYFEKYKNQLILTNALLYFLLFGMDNYQVSTAVAYQQITALNCFLLWWYGNLNFVTLKLLLFLAILNLG